MTEPRDIALAIRTSDVPKEKEAEDGDEGSAASRQSVNMELGDLEEMFEEVGMELVDETQEPEDDDDRRKYHHHKSGYLLMDGDAAMSGLETVRQTLMTHIWPNMMRKPLNTRENPSLIAIEHDSPLASAVEQDATASSAAGSPIQAHFPTTFNYSPAGPSRQRTDPIAALYGNVGADVNMAFPGLDELRAQIQLADLEEFEKSGMVGRMGRLDAMDDDWDDVGPGAEEYARLDEWLDADALSDIPVGHNGLEEVEAEDEGPPLNEKHENADRAEKQLEDDDRPETGDDAHNAFEDDFDDFSAFQSAPSGSESGKDGLLSLDPTPLLLHLQSVRAELAGVSDEDERRVRAGKEVARVMRDLGMGGDLDMDDLDDLHE